MADPPAGFRSCLAHTGGGRPLGARAQAWRRPRLGGRLLTIPLGGQLPADPPTRRQARCACLAHSGGGRPPGTRAQAWRRSRFGGRRLIIPLGGRRPTRLQARCACLAHIGGGRPLGTRAPASAADACRGPPRGCSCCRVIFPLPREAYRLCAGYNKPGRLSRDCYSAGSHHSSWAGLCFFSRLRPLLLRLGLPPLAAALPSSLGCSPLFLLGLPPHGCGPCFFSRLQPLPHQLGLPSHGCGPCFLLWLQPCLFRSVCLLTAYLWASSHPPTVRYRYAGNGTYLAGHIGFGLGRCSNFLAPHGGVASQAHWPAPWS